MRLYDYAISLATDNGDDVVPDECVSVFRGEGWFEWRPEVGDDGLVRRKRHLV